MRVPRAGGLQRFGQRNDFPAPHRQLPRRLLIVRRDLQRFPTLPSFSELNRENGEGDDEEGAEQRNDDDNGEKLHR